MHTHSAKAQVLFVSGVFELQMKGLEARVPRSGSYAYVPANHQHQETCLEDCSTTLSAKVPPTFTTSTEVGKRFHRISVGSGRAARHNLIARQLLQRISNAGIESFCGVINSVLAGVPVILV